MADQFAVLARESPQLETVSSRFKGLEQDPIEYMNMNFSFSMSVEAVSAKQDDDTNELLAIADSRMFSAKARRRRSLDKVAVT